MTPVLEVSGLSQDFGGLRALSDLDLHVDANEIVALIGPNGAGKTTFFNCVTGIYTPTEGKMYLYDADAEKHLLNGKKPHKITAMGMARTFQNIRLFSDMTVLENVMVGRHCRTRAGIWGALSRNGRTRREEQESIDISYALLESLHLQDLWNERARNLAYGAQRRLEIARALATEPRMLLLDEPAAGMNPQETHELEILVRGIRDARNLSILLIEHDMSMVMSLSDRIYVMEYGSCIASGKPGEVRANPRVIKAYLGESDA
ncbi:ABC transporter ATP-binding protein [Desulfovibrio fairfieldensis]|uniref:ABC transporter ATP-binding protein n=1 Tax=Desulfovibrio fairfieldensis TaxID=44742 RepID=A0A0X8JKB7_9BACT|nr:ABC transporter ATP-binding protein [Desulfovibrio fairfieldensis]AMD90177.1 ABC transporter ATP-binding protein [Desulfovibrio fairfieldensis]